MRQAVVTVGGMGDGRVDASRRNGIVDFRDGSGGEQAREGLPSEDGEDLVEGGTVLGLL